MMPSSPPLNAAFSDNPFSTMVHHRFSQSTSAVINHLLKLEPQVSAVLSPHAGKTVGVSWPSKGLLPASQLALTITDTQTFMPADPSAVVAVRISVQKGLLAAPAHQRLSHVHIEGDALLAQALGVLSTRLRWDAEHDLAQYIGDVPAVWVVKYAKQYAQLIHTAAQRLNSNISEYVVYESGWLATRAQMQSHQQDLQDLAARIDALSSRLNKA